MRDRPAGLPVKISLFWRTFLMIAALILASVAGTLQLVRAVDRSPPDQQLAWEITSIVNLTRSALVSSEGERRRLLLDELAREEGVVVTPLESNDRVAALGQHGLDAELAARVEQKLHAMLGARTRLAGNVNGVDGLWVSFDIEGDGYWLMLGRDRFERRLGPNWWLIGLMAGLLATGGALAISGLVNRPLARLADALGRVSRGEPPPRLREDLASELSEVNRGFNRMASDLAQLESDRALALAGISHDIRTPLSRLRLEIEMSPIPEADKASMADDVERIDRIVGQFVEYARAGQSETSKAPEAVDVTSLLASIAGEYRSRADDVPVRIELRDGPAVQWFGDPLDLSRVVVNLVENALRYARDPGGAPPWIELSVARDGQVLELLVADHGPGVPADQRDRLLRPFTRVGSERSARGGSGLGLAIVDRIARRYGGRCALGETAGGGLTVRVSLRDASSARGRGTSRIGLGRQ